MKGTIQNLNICGQGCSLYLPADYETGGYYPVVYINGTDELPDILGILEAHFNKECQSFLLLNVEMANWNDDMTPWPAPALTRKSGTFGGHAEVYLDTLAATIKPYIDLNYKTMPEPENTALIGYSLGGLTSLLALYKHEAFGKIGCLSGSLWYDHWLDFMASHQPLHKEAKVYISLGRKEEESKNNRMATVGKCTIKASEILESQLSDISNLKFEWNDGGHFTEIPQRYCRALLWLMKKGISCG